MSINRFVLIIACLGLLIFVIKYFPAKALNQLTILFSKQHHDEISLGAEGSTARLKVEGAKVMVLPGKIKISNHLIEIKSEVIFEIVPCLDESISEPIFTKDNESLANAWQAMIRRSLAVMNWKLFYHEILVPNSLRLISLTSEASHNNLPSNHDEASYFINKANHPRFGTQSALNEAYMDKLDRKFLELMRVDSRPKNNQHYITYKLNVQRIDTLAIAQDGTIRIFVGEPKPAAPSPAKLPLGYFALANLVVHANALPDILSISPYVNSPSRIEQNVSALKRVSRKLKYGQQVKIILWGDSISCGCFASNPQKGFSDLFVQKLENRFPNAHIIFKNRGICGSATSSRLPNFSQEVLSENPDLLIVEFVNDYAMPISQVEDDFCAILKTAKIRGIDVILCTPHWLRPNYMQLNTWTEVANHPYIFKLKELSTRFGVGLADVAKRWEKLDEEGLSPELMLSDDTLHINDRGHEIYAEELVNCFD